MSNSDVSEYRFLNRDEGYVSTRGASLYYQSFGKDKPIIVLHGGPGLNHEYLLPNLLKLAGNHRVIFYDQRGSGKSVPTDLDEDSINIQQFVNDLEVLRKSLGIEKFILVGHSWGGMLAMQYATKYPDRISAMILMNSLPCTSKGIQEYMEEYRKRMKTVDKEIAAIQSSKEFVSGEPRTVASFCRTMFKTYCFNSEDVQKISFNFTSDSTISSLKVTDIFLSSFILKPDIDLRPKLRELQIPTLLIHGDFDPIPVSAAVEISTAIPDSQLVLIERCGHFSYIEKPKEVFEAIDEFLGGN